MDPMGYTDWFLGILIITYYNPYTNWAIQSSKKPGFWFTQVDCSNFPEAAKVLQSIIHFLLCCFCTILHCPRGQHHTHHSTSSISPWALRFQPLFFQTWLFSIHFPYPPHFQHTSLPLQVINSLLFPQSIHWFPGHPLVKLLQWLMTRQCFRWLPGCRKKFMKFRSCTIPQAQVVQVWPKILRCLYWDVLGVIFYSLRVRSVHHMWYIWKFQSPAKRHHHDIWIFLPNRKFKACENMTSGNSGPCFPLARQINQPTFATLYQFGAAWLELMESKAFMSTKSKIVSLYIYIYLYYMLHIYMLGIWYRYLVCIIYIYIMVCYSMYYTIYMYAMSYIYIYIYICIMYSAYIIC